MWFEGQGRMREVFLLMGRESTKGIGCRLEEEFRSSFAILPEVLQVDLPRAQVSM